MRARRLVGGPAAKVWRSFALVRTFSLAAVQPGVDVLLEAVLWRRSGAGVGLVLTWI